MDNKKNKKSEVKKVAPKTPEVKDVKVDIEVKKIPKVDKKKEVNYNIFFIEDSKFFVELAKNITQKENIDDFSFQYAIKFPGNVKIRKRYEKFELITTSKRGIIKGEKNDYQLTDRLGNKLKITDKLFNSLSKEVFGEK